MADSSPRVLVTGDSSPRVLVTGCSTGIGRAVALEFAQRGCAVLATARKLEAIEELKMHGIATASADVTRPATLNKAVADFGRVDLCVANAGLSKFGPLVEQELEKIEQVLQTNVVGVVATVQAVAPSMIERKSGTVVVVGSVSGAMITPYAGAYCASKASVTAICDAMRMELAPFRVRVVEVVTGSIRSNFGANALAESKLPDGSRYATLQSYIDARAMSSQGPGAMDAAVYARLLADATLGGGRCPPRLVLGGNALKYHLIGRWMPRQMWARKISTQLGLHRLGESLPATDGMPPLKLALLAAAAVGAVGIGWKMVTQ